MARQHLRGAGRDAGRLVPVLVPVLVPIPVPPPGLGLRGRGGQPRVAGPGGPKLRCCGCGRHRTAALPGEPLPAAACCCLRRQGRAAGAGCANWQRPRGQGPSLRSSGGHAGRGAAALVDFWQGRRGEGEAASIPRAGPGGPCGGGEGCNGGSGCWRRIKQRRGRGKGEKIPLWLLAPQRGPGGGHPAPGEAEGGRRMRMVMLFLASGRAQGGARRDSHSRRKIQFIYK